VKDYSVFRLMNGLACLGKDIAIGVSDSASERGEIVAVFEEPEQSHAMAP